MSERIGRVIDFEKLDYGIYLNQSWSLKGYAFIVMPIFKHLCTISGVNAHMS